MYEGIESRISTNGGITFTVNTAVTDVPLLLTGSPDLSVNGAVKYWPAGENIIIKGFSMTFPYQFGQGKLSQVNPEPMFVQLNWRDLSGNNGGLDEVGDTGLINIPDPNYWYDMNVFVPVPDGSDSKWFIEIGGLLGQVSQINAPAALNTEELDCTFHLKVHHTSAMIA